jgi:hypothetical protein
MKSTHSEPCKAFLINPVHNATPAADEISTRFERAPPYLFALMTRIAVYNPIKADKQDSIQLPSNKIRQDTNEIIGKTIAIRLIG